MADGFLIAITIILTILLLIVNFYLLALFCHPEDRGWGTSLMCKILVILGLTLSWSQLLILPLDVANSRGLGAGLDIQQLWEAIYMIILVMICILLPFAIFMYETDDEKSIGSRFCSALFLEFCTLVIICLVLFISWAFLKFADIPLQILSQNYKIGSNVFQNGGDTAKFYSQDTNNSTVEYEVSFPIYCMALLSFIGWIFFVLFGGVGLSALPIDMINEFINRPQLRSSKDATAKKAWLKSETIRLIEQGSKIKDEEKEVEIQGGWWDRRKKKNQVKGLVNKFQVAVIELEKEHEIFKLELKFLDINPLVFIGKLIIGCIFVVVSLLWWLQILLYVAIKVNGFPLYPFLNNMLIGLENGGAGFIATGLFAFLGLYLLWCTQKGNFKMGVRIPFLFTIHPMKVNETWMNSFLFNVLLILICSVSVTQFTSVAFSMYARSTDIDMMFNYQIRYLRFFIWFYDNQVFEIALLVWSAIVCIFLVFRPAQKSTYLRQIEEIRNQKPNKD